MTKVSTLRSDIRLIQAPEQLTDKVAWVMWRYEHVPGKEKPLKVPYYINGNKRFGVQGSDGDVRQLASFEAAKAAAAKRGFDGVGFVTLPRFGIVALDFDDCVTGSGIHPEVEAVIAGTYSEFSPSGEGIRAFFEGELRDSKSTLHVNPQEEYGLEVFHKNGFVTFTGNVTEVCNDFDCANSVAPVSKYVKALFDKRFPPAKIGKYEGTPLGLSLDDIATILDAVPTEIHHDTWFRIGMAIHFEHQGAVEAFDLWDDFTSRYPKNQGREYNMYRWDSFGREGKEKYLTGRYLLKLGRQYGVNIVVGISDAEFDSLIVPDEDDPIWDEPSVVGAVGVSGDASDDEFADLVGAASNAPEKEPPVQNAEVVAAALALTAPKYKFPVIPAHLFAQGKPIEWHIKHFLPKRSLIVLFGESGVGKSFVTIDFTMAVARGLDRWRDKRVKKGRVVYIVAEGQGGFRSRLNAYAEHHGFSLAEVDYGVIEVPPNLMHQPDILELCKSIGEEGTRRCDLVVIDTLAQTTPGGNENSSEDMGLVIANCQKMMHVLKTSVLLVHHAGKDTTKGARGWSGLRGASDCQIEVVGDGQGNTVAKVVKLKERSAGELFGYHLDVIPLGLDEDGDENSTCVAVEAAISSDFMDEKSTRMGSEQALYYEAYQDLTAEYGDSGVPLECWEDRIRELKKAKLVESGEFDQLDSGQKKAKIRVNRKPKSALFEGENPRFRLEDGKVFEN